MWRRTPMLVPTWSPTSTGRGARRAVRPPLRGRCRSRHAVSPLALFPLPAPASDVLAAPLPGVWAAHYHRRSQNKGMAHHRRGHWPQSPAAGRHRRLTSRREADPAPSRRPLCLSRLSRRPGLRKLIVRRLSHPTMIRLATQADEAAISANSPDLARHGFFADGQKRGKDGHLAVPVEPPVEPRSRNCGYSTLPDSLSSRMCDGTPSSRSILHSEPKPAALRSKRESTTQCTA